MSKGKPLLLVDIDNIWSFAIQRETEAVRFYTNLANTAKRHESVKLFDHLAEEERSHEKRFGVLRGMDFVDSGAPRESKENPLEVALKVVRFGENGQAGSEEMSYREVLDFAIKSENASCNLYFALAKRTGNNRIREALCALAKEETNHRDKLQAELEQYEEASMSPPEKSDAG